MNLDDLIGYAEHVNADSHVKEWVKNVLSKQEIPLEEAEHIVDFLVSEEGPKRVSRMSFEDAKKATDAWNENLRKKGSEIQEQEGDTEVVLDFGDGFKVVKLIGKNAFEREGYLMRHCVASYADRTDTEVFSLRDEKNIPHCTMEKDQQIKGKGNGDISPKYVDYVVKFLEHIGMTVGDSEMNHIGYMNITSIKEHLHPSVLEKAYRENYLKKDMELIDKYGEPYASLQLLDIKPLFIDDENGFPKINIDIELLCKQAPKWLK